MRLIALLLLASSVTLADTRILHQKVRLEIDPATQTITSRVRADFEGDPPTEFGGMKGVEAELESGILTLEFEDDARFVINSHQAARQIWMAADRSAWHFDWQPSTQSWIATKTSEELWSVLQTALAKKLGEPVTLRRQS